MAIKKATNTKTTWNNRIFFPKDNYILRIIEEEVKISESGNTMTVLEYEITHTPDKVIGDQTIEFNGVKFKTYNVTKNPNDSVKSDACFARYQDSVLVPCGIDCSEGWDDENPPSVKGKVVHALCYATEESQCLAPTPEERAAGKKIGQPIKDPLTDKEVKFFKPTVQTIYGLYTEGSAGL